MQYREKPVGNLVVLIVLLSIFAFLFRVNFIYYILYLFAGIFAWSRWVVPYRAKNLKIRREFVDHTFWGDTVDVKLTVKNDHRVPMPWFEISESLALELGAHLPVNHAFPLRPGETREMSYSFHARRRGYYRVGPARFKTGDLFGLTQEYGGKLLADYLTVYPRIHPIERLGLPSRLPFGTIGSRERLFEDPARPVGVRDFRSGDSIRQINWKVSAHTRNLVVKTLQPAISLETMLILNLDNDAYNRWSRATVVEWSIEVAASIAAYLNRQQQAVGFMSNGLDPVAGQATEDLRFDGRTGRLADQQGGGIAGPIVPKTGRANLIKLFEQLARIETSEKVPFQPWLTARPIPLSWGGAAVVITPHANATLCNVLHRTVRQGINPVLMITEKHSDFPQIRERCRRLGFRAYEVIDKKDLDDQSKQ